MNNIIETDKYKLVPLVVEAPPIETNCYLLIDQATKKAVVIDPGYSPEFIKQTADDEGAEIVMIINTHGHWDHTSANEPLIKLTGAELLINERDLPIFQDGNKYCKRAYGGDVIQLGELSLQALLTPGHSPGSISLICEDLLFSGDVLFQLSMGRTDFPYGSEADIMASLRRLASLPGNKIVCSGHGPLTNLDFERKYNPFIKMSGYQA